MRKRLFLFPIMILFIWACSTDAERKEGADFDDAVSFDRSAMLINWADNIIIPSYEAFENDLNSFNIAFGDFSADPTAANLVTLRASWLEAYKSWQKVSMFEIGTAETVGLRLNLNTYPTDVGVLEQFVASGSYDFTLPSNRDVKGFPALDYLINGLAATDAEIVAVYATGTNKDAYLTYFKDVLDDMVSLTSQVRSDWNNTYRDTFVSNDGASSTASVDRFVNDYIFYYEKFLRAGKMGIPLGVFSGTAKPNTIEAYYKADISKELFLEGLDAVQDFFNGRHYGSATTGESLATYLQALNTVKEGEQLDVLINQQLNTARNAVSALGTFRDEIENNSSPTNMLLAYDEVQRLVPLFKVDMVSAMSIGIDFVDADGD